MAYDPFAAAGESSKVKWNYSRPNDPDYTDNITGVVMELKQVQRTNAMNQQPEFWPNGDPKLDIAFIIDVPALGGEIMWSLKNYKGHATHQAATAALKQAGLPTNFTQYLGKQISIMTKDGRYGAGNPRPWSIAILGDSGVEHRGCALFSESNVQPEQTRQQPQAQGRGPVQQQHGQPQFNNPRLEHAFNNATQAVTQAQYSSGQPALYDQDIPF